MDHQPQSHRAHDPKVAIIGTGLAGSVLASRLKSVCQLTVFERGDAAGAAPTDIAMSGHQTGMNPLFYYGVGGTTNLWAGGLIDLLPSEFAGHWPQDVSAELPGYYPKVVAELYGEPDATDWKQRQSQRLGENSTLSSLFYPHSGPFRVADSPLLDDCDIRTVSQVTALRDMGAETEIVYECAGETNTARFDWVIVAAGGIGSPVLLQRSGLGGHAVGQNYTDHPMGFVAKVSKVGQGALLKTLRQIGYGGGNGNAMIKIQDRVSGLHSGFYFRSAAHGRLTSDPYARSFKVLAERDRFRRIYAAVSQFHDADFRNQAIEDRCRIRLHSPFSYVLVVNEQEATGQGQVVAVSHSEPVLRRWTISPTVTGAIERNLETLREILNCEIRTAGDGIEKRLYAAAHLSGTCRMSSDPDLGVVDKNLLVHGTSRIFVCDGSVLPSTGASNTGLTIAALAHRLADHLCKAI